jgi:hypothetical protein
MCRKALGRGASDFATTCSQSTLVWTPDDWAPYCCIFSTASWMAERPHSLKCLDAYESDSSLNFCKQHAEPNCNFRSGFGLHTMACFPELQGQVGKTLF